jgi:cell wall-associated NlpC family hydrolase
MIAQPVRRKLVNTGALMMLLVLGACSSAPPVSVDQHSRHQVIGEDGNAGHRAAAVALQQVGTPYRYGGATPNGFDCSGLVQYAYSRAGKRVPRTTGQLWSQLQPVPPRDLQPGDVLFFRIEGKMSHVGLYLGDSRFVHAPSTGRTVTVAMLDAPFYEASLIRAGRPR